MIHEYASDLNYTILPRVLFKYLLRASQHAGPGLASRAASIHCPCASLFRHNEGELLRQSAIITTMMVRYAVQPATFPNLTFVMSLFISLNTVTVGLNSFKLRFSVRTDIKIKLLSGLIYRLVFQSINLILLFQYLQSRTKRQSVKSTAVARIKNQYRKQAKQHFQVNR